MGQGIRVMQLSDNKSVVLEQLRKEQNQCREGSFVWHEIQAKINRIIAQNYLEYVNT